MHDVLPKIWFERPVLPDLVAEVAARAEMLTPDEAHPLLGLNDASGALAGVLDYDAVLMDEAPKLRVICRTGIGVDRVDIEEATRRGIAVCNTPEGPTISTAEHALGLILAAAKNLKRTGEWLRAGETDMFARNQAIELAGKTLGLVGYGRIPRRVAVAAAALDMYVAAYDPHLDSAAFGDVAAADSLESLLAVADVVSVHTPLTAETKHLFGPAEFGAMKQGAVFVNTSRGGVVDQDALLSALDSGHLLSAGLDVTDPEPLPASHPLLNRDNVLVTPHVASGTHEGKRRMFRTAFEQAIQVLAGERPAHLVNPEVWARFEVTS